MTRTVALIVGAGRGHRFGGETPKQYRDYGGEPLFRHALRAFADHPDVDAVQPVIHLDDLSLFETATEGLDVMAPVGGGDSRQESVLRGLRHLQSQPPDRVLIHDAARPFVDHGLIERVLAGLDSHGGAVPAIPVTDTLKAVTDGVIDETVDRSRLWRVQTPQGFRYREILAAHEAAAGLQMTDDAAVAEHVGLSVAIVDGDSDNMKITRAEDLKMTELPGANWEYRTGHGFDVHRFGDGDGVILCGVEIAHDQGLVGHSDADVGLHALTDAILGAVGAADIGEHFPPSDPQWRGAPSSVFVEHAARAVHKLGGEIVNIDVTLICEKPKIGPNRVAMRDAVAAMLEIAPGRVNVKATTTERLGFTGRGEGIAAQAIATVRVALVNCTERRL